MKFGAIWKDIRKRRKLTQAKMAELMGVCTATIHLWETNKRSPNGVYLMRLFYLASKQDQEYLYGKLLKPWIEWHKIEVDE